MHLIYVKSLTYSYPVSLSHLFLIRLILNASGEKVKSTVIFMSIFSISRLHSMVRGTAGPLCYQLSGRRSGPGGCLYHPAQPSCLVACQTGPSVSAGCADQDGILLHHSTGPPGKRTPRNLLEDAFIIPNTFPPLLFSVSLYQILMHFWQPVTGAPCLWSVRHAPWSIWLPLLCFSLHFLCWAIICSILMLFDYPELLGIKQVNWLRCVNT